MEYMIQIDRMFSHQQSLKWVTNVFNSSMSEKKNERFQFINVRDEKPLISHHQNSRRKMNVFTTLTSKMRLHDEAMMNLNHDQKIFEWVTNLLSNLVQSLLLLQFKCALLLQLLHLLLLQFKYLLLLQFKYSLLLQLLHLLLLQFKCLLLLQF